MRITRAIKHAAEILKTGKKHLWIDPEQQAKLETAITKDDIRQLISERTIRKKPKPFHSRGRARILGKKKAKGRKGGKGKKKGTKKARMKPKKQWMNKVRVLRKKLRELKKASPGQVKKIGYQKLYGMIKGNYFRGKKYLEQYVATN